MSAGTGETPRTDALLAEYPQLFLRPMEQREERGFGLARQLERELAAETQRREAFQKAIAWIVSDAKYKAPEQWNEVMLRWFERLTAALSQQEQK